jgi:SARP family transcriptional regulator, regulator of embCAB operon
MHGHYMLALHRSGQRTRALAVYQRLRLAMTEELGLEPSAKLQRLQQAVLASDPRLDHEAGAPGRGPVVA